VEVAERRRRDASRHMPPISSIPSSQEAPGRKMNQKQIERDRKAGFITGTFQCTRCKRYGLKANGGYKKHRRSKACINFGKKNPSNTPRTLDIDAYLGQSDDEMDVDTATTISSVPSSPEPCGAIGEFLCISVKRNLTLVSLEIAITRPVRQPGCGLV
jgi:hypothetical protein